MPRPPRADFVEAAICAAIRSDFGAGGGGSFSDGGDIQFDTNQPPTGGHGGGASDDFGPERGLAGVFLEGANFEVTYLPGRDGGVGGGGGGGLPSGNPAPSEGGDGGLGGGGGGGGEGGRGGDGGFGGGGGAGGYNADGGNGGFGGGGGGASDDQGVTRVGGKGGFAAGNAADVKNGVNGSAGGGGGGAGLGGAIFNINGTVKITNSTVIGNSANGGLGGLGSTAAFNGGNASGLGGGIFNRNGSVSISNSVFCNNTAPQGGADVFGGFSGSFSGCTISGTDGGRFIERLYFDLLGRRPDSFADKYVTDLDSGERSKFDVAFEVAHSDEYLARVVTDLYRRFLNRAPDAEGLATYVHDIQDGKSIEEVSIEMLASAEYRAQSNSAADFIANLYADVLGRAPDQEAAFKYGAIYGNGTQGEVAKIVREVVTSDEARRIEIDKSYAVLLNRAPDPQSRIEYAGQLETGRSILDIIAELAASDEYSLTTLLV